MLSWLFRDRSMTFGPAAVVMGIVNVTPDSFSDGGKHLDPERAVAVALEMVEQGAKILDIGGESSRPGAEPVSVQQELDRVIPVVRELRRRSQIPISVDTVKAEVAQRALAEGADIINDITAFLGDPAMTDVAKRYGAGVILMHMQGTPRTMQVNPTYTNVTNEIVDFLQARLQQIEDLGIARSRVVIDPGVGFGKTTLHNLTILRDLGEFRKTGRPICLGVSRKSLLGRLLQRPVEQRLAGSLAAACFALAHNSVDILRVHDVGPTADAVRFFEVLSSIEAPLPSGG
jgi:dihydropteroate synthase